MAHTKTATFIVVVVLMTAGCSQLAGDSTDTTAPGSSPAQSAASSSPTQKQPVIDGLKILNAKLTTTEHGTVAVTGQARNAAGHELAYAQLTPKFYDSSGARLGSGLANINNLAAGETWQFEATYPSLESEEVAHATIGEMRLTASDAAPVEEIVEDALENPERTTLPDASPGGDVTTAPTSSEPTTRFATETATETQPAAPTRSATPTTTATTSPRPTTQVSGGFHTLVIVGGSPEEKVNYRFGASGGIERSGHNYSAPIDEEAVTRDPGIDLISDDRSRVSGRLGGGGDAYRYAGAITEFEAEGDVEVYIDGQRAEQSEVAEQ